MSGSSVIVEPSVKGEPSVVPDRELDVGRLVVLGTVACVPEIVIITVLPVELDLKEVVGECVIKTVDDVVSLAV